MTQQYDCQACGACCGPARDGDKLPLRAKDVGELSTHYQRLHVIYEVREGTKYFLNTKETEHSGLLCVALRGQVGKRVSCSIYGRRPKQCRDFKPGGRHCKWWRRWRGLPV
jgi:Fe-S-cluster containining protein